MSDYPDNWGQIISWRQWGTVTDGRLWCMDNDAFTVGFKPDPFFERLREMKPYQDTCLFVNCPDVVGDAIATIDNYRWWAWKIKALGYPVSFVAQDGQEYYDLPPEYDALFIGGTTDWKLSPAVDKLIRQAQDDGKWVHVGRVNSQKRIRHFQLVGVDSVDGTTIAYGPDVNRKVLQKQLNQRVLFEV